MLAITSTPVQSTSLTIDPYKAMQNFKGLKIYVNLRKFIFLNRSTKHHKQLEIIRKVSMYKNKLEI